MEHKRKVFDRIDFIIIFNNIIRATTARFSTNGTIPFKTVYTYPPPIFILIFNYNQLLKNIILSSHSCSFYVCLRHTFGKTTVEKMTTQHNILVSKMDKTKSQHNILVLRKCDFSKTFK